MTFLASLAASILEWILSKLFSLVAKDVSQAEKDKANSKEAQAEADSLKKAKTDEELNKAINDSLNNL